MHYHLSRNRRALNLLETTLAVFLLAAQIVIFVGAMARFRQTQKLAHRRQVAALLGEEKLDEIRAWARQPVNFASNWSPYQGQVSQPQPGYRLEVACQPAGQPLYSPCLGLESPYAANAKVLRHSLVPVRVTVAYATTQLQLNTLIGEPVRPGPYRLELDQAPVFTQPVVPNGDFGFAARAVDGNGQPIEDLQLGWVVKPVTGNASLLEGGNRSQHQIVARHRYLRYGVPVHISGRVQLQCRAHYHGQAIVADTPDVVLQP